MFEARFVFRRIPWFPSLNPGRLQPFEYKEGRKHGKKILVRFIRQQRPQASDCLHKDASIHSCTGPPWTGLTDTPPHIFTYENQDTWYGKTTNKLHDRRRPSIARVCAIARRTPARRCFTYPTTTKGAIYCAIYIHTSKYPRLCLRDTYIHSDEATVTANNRPSNTPK